jgi:hypothetical protein
MWLYGARMVNYRSELQCNPVGSGTKGHYLPGDRMQYSPKPYSFSFRQFIAIQASLFRPVMAAAMVLLSPKPVY